VRALLALFGAVLGVVPVSAQSPARWRLVEDWRVGGEVDGPHSLGDVRGLGLLRDGRLVVLDARDQQVHFLDPRGRPLRTVGRKGAGPGEFRNANGFLVTADDHVIVNDPGNSRFTVLTSSGELRRTIPITQPWGQGYLWDAFLDSTGRVDEWLPMATPTEPRRSGRRRWSLDFARTDSAVTPPCPYVPGERRPSFTTYEFVSEKGGRFIQVPFLFPATSQARSRRGGMWTSSPPPSRTLRHRPPGQCTPDATITLDGEQVPIPRVSRDSAVAMILQSARDFGAPSPDLSHIPTAYPAFNAIWVDGDDHLWTERMKGGGMRFLEVYTRNGRLVARIDSVTPFADHRPVILTRDRVVALVNDDDGVPWLVGLRIERQGPRPASPRARALSDP
jgi:hypothetical protein